MFIIAINNPSFDIMFKTKAHFYDDLASVISAIDFVDRGLRAKSANLLIDCSVENFKILADGTLFSALIGSCPDRDLKRKWFLYSRNRAIPLSYIRTSVEFSLPEDGASFLKTEIALEIATSALYYLSASARTIFSCTEFNVTAEGADPIYITNSRDKTHVGRWWPKFEPSEKHKKYSYMSNGEFISAMPLSDAEAQEALEISTLEGRERHVIFHGKKYRFLLTHPGRNVYHGFLVEE